MDEVTLKKPTFLSNMEFERYKQTFIKENQTIKKTTIEANLVKSVLTKTKIQQTILYKIWELSCLRNSNNLSFYEFCLAMFFTNEHLNNRKIPDVLDERIKREIMHLNENLDKPTFVYKGSSDIKDEDIANILRLLRQHKSINNEDHIPIELSKDILQKSGIEKKDLYNIWEKVDYKKNGMFKIEQLIAALHLTRTVKIGETLEGININKMINKIKDKIIEKEKNKGIAEKINEKRKIKDKIESIKKEIKLKYIIAPLHNDEFVEYMKRIELYKKEKREALTNKDIQNIISGNNIEEKYTKLKEAIENVYQKRLENIEVEDSIEFGYEVITKREYTPTIFKSNSSSDKVSLKAKELLEKRMKNLNLKQSSNGPFSQYKDEEIRNRLIIKKEKTEQLKYEEIIVLDKLMNNLKHNRDILELFLRAGDSSLDTKSEIFNVPKLLEFKNELRSKAKTAPFNEYIISMVNLCQNKNTTFKKISLPNKNQVTYTMRGDFDTLDSSSNETSNKLASFDDLIKFKKKNSVRSKQQKEQALSPEESSTSRDFFENISVKNKTKPLSKNNTWGFKSTTPETKNISELKPLQNNHTIKSSPFQTSTDFHRKSPIMTFSNTNKTKPPSVPILEKKDDEGESFSLDGKFEEKDKFEEIVNTDANHELEITENSAKDEFLRKDAKIENIEIERVQALEHEANKTKTYKAVYEYENDSGFKLNEEEIVHVIDYGDADGDWWYGYAESDPNKEDWFPKSYVTLIESKERPRKLSNGSRFNIEETSEEKNILEHKDEFYKAVYDYQAQNQDELDLRSGDTIKVLSKGSDDGWWMALLNQKEGLVPNNYLEPVKDMATENSITKLKSNKPTMRSVNIKVISKSQSLNDLKTKPHTLELVMNELLQTEKTYLNTLNKIIKTYMIPTQQLLGPEKTAQIFINIKELRRTNLKFYGMLKENKEKVGTVFTSNLELIHQHKVYCTNQYKAMIKLQSELKYNKQFSDLIYEIKKNSSDANGLGLEAHLLTPMQRITRYKLMIEKILETNKKQKHINELELKTIQDVYELIKQALSEINNNQSSLSN